MSLAVQVERAGGWQDHARCVGADLDLFFPDSGDTHRAKAFCAGCPVWQECLAYGLDEDHGVWGGLNRAERARLRRLRQRFAVTPADPANAKDIRRLMAVGVSPDRVCEMIGCSLETVVDTLVASERRRPKWR